MANKLPNTEEKAEKQKNKTMKIQKINPKVGEQILNLGGNAYVKQVISDTEVFAEYFGIKQTVKIVGRAPNGGGFFGQLCAA